MNAALIVAEQLCWEAGAGLLDPPRDASPVADRTPDQPMDGLDTAWPSVVTEALGLIGLEAEQLAAARLHAFDVVESIRGGTAEQDRPPRTP
jgi:hypothetical protein